MKVDLYGQRIEVIREISEWVVFYLGVDGKRRRAKDIVIPATESGNQELYRNVNVSLNM